MNDRDERALGEYLTVLEDVGGARDAEELYLGVSQSGSEYLVDARDGVCECPDYEYREVRCKHLRRVAFATGAEPIPAGVDVADDQLGAHVNGTPRVTATDGGEIVKAGDGAEVLDESGEEADVVDLATVTGNAEPAEADRPAGCQCWGADGLPCFPCHREGFTVANPETPGVDR